MGIFQRFFKNRQNKSSSGVSVDSYYKMLNSMPIFKSWDGCIYENELVRSSIDARARHISKLSIEINTAKQSRLLTYLKHQPNDRMTWSQFMYRLSTILDVHNTAFVVPLFDDDMRIVGYYPILPSSVEIVAGEDVDIVNDEYIVNMAKQTPWLKYRWKDGHTDAVPLKFCATLMKFQYGSEFFGENNNALRSTMELINIQNQAIQNAVKNSAGYRFMAQVNNFTKSDDLAKERKRFSEENLSADSDAGGLLLFPNTYQDIKQISSNPFTVDSKTMELIEKNVYNYYGVNADILQNKAYGDAWTSYYEGAIEPFAVQFSETMSRVLFTDIERSNGSGIFATTNRLQFLSNADKLTISTNMADRGIMTRNEIRDIWNLPHLPNGDSAVIRGEYYQENEGGTFTKVNSDDILKKEETGTKTGTKEAD